MITAGYIMLGQILINIFKYTIQQIVKCIKILEFGHRKQQVRIMKTIRIPHTNLGEEMF
jgi:hypothetical protein